MAFCTRCGAQIPDGAKFCTSCGAPVAAAPAANPTPRPAPQPAQAPPRATTTPQGGIVIDAPAGSTVNISNTPPASAGVAAPAEKGEFTLISWDDEASPTPQQPYQQPYQQPQYPQYQQPQYPQQPYQQAPQYPQQPQGPMTVKQALNKSKQDIFGKYMPNQAQQAAPAPEKKKKRSIWVWLLLILIGLVYMAMKFNW